MLGCSTAGEIVNNKVIDDSLTLTSIYFEHTDIKCERIKIKTAADSFKDGKSLAKSLMDDDLAHIFVLSKGININGSELVKGLTDSIPKHVTVSGGLSGDGDRFGKTHILWNKTI